MGATISTHNGSAVARDHNIRNRKVTDKEGHIDPNGRYEIWHDERLVDAYHRIFDEAVDRYNAKQKRADRKIENYLTEVKKDGKKHPVYEMIIGIYGGDYPNEIREQIMRDFVGGWKERNPNLEMIGAYFHADEPGAAPHVHIDYIPVARGYKRGMDTQNGLAKALEQQGLWGGKDGLTGQIRWEKRENAVLEMICNDYGIEVEHPGTKRDHLDTPEYKALTEEIQKVSQERDSLKEEVTALKEQAKAERSTASTLAERTRAVRQEHLKAYSNLQKAEGDLKERRETIKELDAFIEGSHDEIAAYEEQINELRDTHNNLSENIDSKRQELQEAHEGAEKAKANTDALRVEESALTASVGALRAEHAELTEEVSVLRQAVKREYHDGTERFGEHNLAQRIEAARKEREKDARIKNLEQTVSFLNKFLRQVLEKFPPIRKLWEQAQAEYDRQRSQQKDRNDWTK